MKTLICCLLFSSSALIAHAAKVTGIATLDGPTNHAGITVDFIPKTSSSVWTSTTTNSSGHYITDVVNGVYNIQFSMPEFIMFTIVDVTIAGAFEVESVMLHPDTWKPVIEVNGAVSGTWTPESRYKITGATIIMEGSELTIQAGTIVMFAGGEGMEVRGKINVLGTYYEPVLITSEHYSKYRGDWADIKIASTGSGVFKACILEYGGASDADGSKGIITSAGSLVLEQCVIAESASNGVVSTEGSVVEIKNSRFTDNSLAGLSVSGGKAVVSNSGFDRNDTGISASAQGFKLTGSIILSNSFGLTSSNGGLVDGNIFYGNSVYGLNILANSPVIRRNTFYQNWYAIYYSDTGVDSGGIISSNIFADNYQYVLYSDDVELMPDEFKYNMVSASDGAAFTNFWLPGLGEVVTTNHGGYDADVYYNFFEEPDFYTDNYEDVNYLFLNVTSPAIDGGDPELTDPDGSIADCGARYFQKFNQVIWFNVIDDQTFGDADVQLEAVASTELPVTFSSSDPAIASIIGDNSDRLHFNSPGRVTITATQEGNDDFKKASVGQSICVNPTAPEVTVSGPTSSRVLTSSRDSNNQWYLNGDIIENATDKSYTATGDGYYTVRTIVDGCSSTDSEANLIVGLVLEEMAESMIRIFPNPVVDELFLETPQSASVNIIDVTGRMLGQYLITGVNDRIDVSFLSNGVYFLRVETTNNVTTQRFLKL